MKIEIGESLMLSWAKHIKHCQIATLNWKYSDHWQAHNKSEIARLINNMRVTFSTDIFGQTRDSDQIISQAEIDVLAITIDNSTLKDIFAIDVAFHENGLHYSNNLNKITEKMLRSALVLYSVFNTKTGNIIFASPKVQPKDLDVLKNRIIEIEQFMKKEGFNFNFEFICNSRFYNDILLPVQEKIKTISDTSELFLRSLQMVSLFKEDNGNQTKRIIPTLIRAQTDRQSGSTTDINNNIVGFCFSFGHEYLYPKLNQQEAFQTAAKTLGIKPNTLKNIRDYFDFYNPKSKRKGWDIPLTDVRNQILKTYLEHPEQAFDKARQILKIK